MSKLWNHRKICFALLAGSFLAAVRLTWWAFYE
jgi:hypothetical protein